MIQELRCIIYLVLLCRHKSLNGAIAADSDPFPFLANAIRWLGLNYRLIIAHLKEMDKNHLSDETSNFLLNAFHFLRLILCSRLVTEIEIGN